MAIFNRAEKAGWVLVGIAALVGGRILAQNAPAPPPVRVDISGDWMVVTQEDTPNYGPGPELGDYTGLPINAAVRQKAEAWDATILSQPERQTQTHPIIYVGNNRGPQRILKILDPVTQTQVAYALAGNFGRADRIVWLDGRSHPSDYSEHTWDGYSTGQWDQNGAFVITTTHMKSGVIRRNGVATTPYAKMVEHFIRHGLYMSVSIWIDDPIYLEEPFMRNYTEVWNPGGQLVGGVPFQSVDELGDKPLGWVPFFALGTKQAEFAETNGLPFEVTQGGAEKTYPEYQLRIQQLMREEAAKTAAARRSIPPSASNPLIGIWVLDRAKSTFSDDTGPAKRTMIFESAGTAIKHTTMTTTAAAFPDNYQITYTSKLDGQDAPVTGTAFDTYALKRIDARTIQRTAKIKGEVFETVTYAVSADAQVLTVTTNGKDTAGVEYSRIEVLKRQ